MKYHTVDNRAMASQMNLLDIESEKIFPSHFRILGWILVVMTLPVLIYAPVMTPIVLIAGSGMVWSHSGVMFDSVGKRYRHYNSFWGLKFGNWQVYDQAVKLFVNIRKTSQFLYTRVNTGSTIRGMEFTAFVKLENEDKVFLTSKTDKEKLMVEVQKVADFFDLAVIDNS